MPRSHLIIRHYQSYIKETLEENERTKNKKPMGLFAYFLFFCYIVFWGYVFWMPPLGWQKNMKRNNNSIIWDPGELIYEIGSIPEEAYLILEGHVIIETRDQFPVK